MSAPALSAVVVTPTSFAQIRRTVRHLREQDAADQVELVLVAPADEACADHRSGELDGFWGVQVVAAGAITNVDHASAHGLRAAAGDAVAVIEDHAYVQPGWASAVIEEYRTTDAGAVASLMRNANPSRMLSWMNLLIAYGSWTSAEAAGDVDEMPSHNFTVRRSALAPYLDEALEARLGRDGDLFDRLGADGARFRLTAAGQVAHVNPSRAWSTADLRVNAGRLYGATRAAGWSLARRLVYVGGGPLIPVVRLRRVIAEHFSGGRYAHLVPRIYPALLFGLVCDALGQMLGYAAGIGGSRDKLATFEMDRLGHITAADRRSIAE